MVSTPTLDREEFRRWLAGLPPAAKAGGPDCCPLQRFLRERGVPDATVGINAWYSGITLIRTHTLPDWADRFTDWVDRSPHPEGRRWELVTAAECLAALEGIQC